jgi:hypothetical protein
MLLTSDAFNEFEEKGFLLLDNNPNTSSLLLDHHLDSIEIDKGAFPNPVYFIEPQNRNEVITSVVHLLRNIRNRSDLAYFWDFNWIEKTERQKVFLAIEDEVLGILPLPLFQSLELLNHEKIIFSVRRNNKSLIGFDIFVSKYDNVPDQIPFYPIGSSTYNIIIKK